MTTSIQALRHEVAQQTALLPGMYGSIDFERRPERFTDDVEVRCSMPDETLDQRPRLLADRDMVAAMEAFTMLGDSVADAYAALIPEVGFRRLLEMLDQACTHGVEAVEDAPGELVALIEDMERVPDWIDISLIERGAFEQRKISAIVMPFLYRAAFVATFVNSYAALPMVTTGALSSRAAGKRMTETAAFFSCTTLPGGLQRYSTGFRATARVRLMHSMVRFNILARGQWDSSVYGMPIPQADQMPVGLTPLKLEAERALSRGRDTFTPAARAKVEFYRYRCFLLGLPEELLPDTPQGVLDVLATREATLRDRYDDDTCGTLVRTTMSANVEPDRSLLSRTRHRFGLSFATVFFVRFVLAGDTGRAAEMGLLPTAGDWLRAAATGVYVGVQLVGHVALERIPVLRHMQDGRLVKKLNRELDRYGYAEFVTDPSTYDRP
ncbi:oxygenase MpaB family protein [Rhodococcus sp. MEB064]|uniref:oxygenase MpaB family protein n=1 Tax=Rhodococcus sp. MEB064 TaxID=1587522 RepID=UPI0005ACA401|nr:oxygenase MpaB family protein [Rhodococcus sp. MEB064]KIQ18421.1 hypothetical protein RU01_07550 [Rhodococcus sp. MEB064]